MDRLRRRADFRAASSGKRTSAGGFVLQARLRDDDGGVRVGFTVSRQVGNAVERNRVRRRLREIVIIRIAHLNGVDYVLAQHVPGLALAEGLTLPECDALADWRATALFDARERAALAYAEAMTMGTSVPDAVFAEVRRHFSDREIVELSVLVGTYIMHNRVMKALAIDLEPEANRGR